MNMARFLHEQRDEAISTIEELSSLKVPERIARLFARLAEEHGVPEAGGTRIALRLTHADIASLVGSTRETVTLEVGKLRVAGRIATLGDEFFLPSRIASG